jgi:quercetin dioxygenase-like cupin family protein
MQPRLDPFTDVTPNPGLNNQVPRLAQSKSFGVMAAIAALTLVPGAALAQSAPRGTVTPAFREAIPNIPGKSIVAVVVSYPPGGKTPPHRHARSAFVTAYVLSGAIRSQVDDGPVQVFRAGESWSERPGAHHTISENASTTEPAKLLAISVVDTNDTELTTFDGQ